MCSPEVICEDQTYNKVLHQVLPPPTASLKLIYEANFQLPAVNILPTLHISRFIDDFFPVFSNAN